MRKEGFENLILTGPTEGRRSIEKQRVTYLRNLYEWIAEKKQIVKGQNLFRET